MFVGSQIYWGGTIDCETSVPVYASADGNTFNATTGIPNCYSVQDLLVVDEQHVARAQNYFDGTESYMYRWMNDLEEWEEIAPYNLGSPWIRLVDHNGAIYAYGKAPGDTSKGIYQSVDMGQNWKPIVVLENPDVSSMFVHNNTLYIGTEHDMDNNVYIYRILFDDLTPPEVESTNPQSGETDVSTGITITATFSEEMGSTSIDENSFTLKTDTSQIPGTVTYDSSTKQASFTLDDSLSLDYDTVYTATITTDVQDLAGNHMAAEYSWSFTTTDGLVASYPFNGNADDETGNGYDGIIHGDTSLCEDRFGNSDSAYCFDGDGDYIEIPVMNFLQDFTVTAWFFANSTSDWARIFDFGIGNYGDCFLTVKHKREGGELGVTIHDSSSSLPPESEFGAGIKVENGIWYFVAFTYDKGGDGMALYVDGQIKNSHPYNSESFDDWGESQKWYFGKSNWADDPYFHGVMDDIRIYNRALSEAEIKALYNEVEAISIDPIEDGTIRDGLHSPKDGVPDNIMANVVVQILDVKRPELPFEDRGIIEFSILSLTERISKAELVLNVFSSMGPFPFTVDVFTYKGDGILTLDDFNKGSLFNSFEYSGESTITLDVSSFIKDLAGMGDNFAGFNFQFAVPSTIPMNGPFVAFNSLEFPPAAVLIVTE
jgi:hypothetical protein